ncbi:MAG TPA: YqgE/AlgH family protein [Longimicrobiales bacterium]|nr:YqgE/AlgH family protein [Longimicrobiales bacterium]
MESLKGKLLLSAGDLFDPNFRQTVVLLGEHDEAGAVGVVLNRPLDVTVAQAVPVLSGLVGPDESLFQGGPVEPDQAVLLAEAASPDDLDVPVLGEVGFLTGDVPAAVRHGLRRARVYVGHSGWGPGQLEGELAADSWIIADATPDDIFTAEPGDLWRRILKRLGPPHDALARIPFDPTMN